MIRSITAYTLCMFAFICGFYQISIWYVVVAAILYFAIVGFMNYIEDGEVDERVY